MLSTQPDHLCCTHSFCLALTLTSPRLQLLLLHGEVMKHIILTLLSAGFTTLTAAAPSPLVSRINAGTSDIPHKSQRSILTREKDITNSTLSSHPSLNPRTSKISIELGTTRTNVGNELTGTHYNNVYQALQRACDFNTIGNNPCTNTQAKFPVWVEIPHTAAPSFLVREDLTVTVKNAVWKGNRNMYYLLIAAVAGAFERGSWGSNCADFEYVSYEYDSYLVRFHRTHCNTISSAHVVFPGGYEMQVSFASSSATGVFDCIGVKE
jgi:hypothetical protein